MASISGGLGGERGSPLRDQTRHFGPPSFNLFADSGGGGSGSGGVGGGSGGYEPPDDPERDLQISNACNALDANAAGDWTGATGHCAKAVADALYAAGGPSMSIPAPHYAKDFGPVLEANGFYTIPNDLPHEKGDVAVIQPAKGENPAGHAAMWDGNKWVFGPQTRESGFRLTNRLTRFTSHHGSWLSGLLSPSHTPIRLAPTLSSVPAKICASHAMFPNRSIPRRLRGFYSRKAFPDKLRMVRFYDSEKDRRVS